MKILVTGGSGYLGTHVCRFFNADDFSRRTGHDANQLAKIAPIGTLFVPSRGGRSHCPEEWTEPEDMVLGARALLACLIAVDAALG